MSNTETEFYGIWNGHYVDSHLLRGGDVSKAGIDTLKRAGVSLVICLKNPKQDSVDDILDEQRWVLAAGMKWLHAPLDSQGICSYRDGPSKTPAILAAILAEPKRVFVGCHKGSDRTGVIVAIYRITKGATAAEALAEMKHYGASWIHFAMRQFVRNFSHQQEGD